nr:isoprenylcysteine alpha-carbonyl methylesterase icme [Quercus suber]
MAVVLERGATSSSVLFFYKYHSFAPLISLLSAKTYCQSMSITPVRDPFIQILHPSSATSFVPSPTWYNLLNLVDHFNNRGLYRSIFLSIMEGEQGLQRFSPEVKIQDKSIRVAVSHLPPISLFHGTSDYSIPSDASKTFVDAL